jgi:cytochrome c553
MRLSFFDLSKNAKHWAIDGWMPCFRCAKFVLNKAHKRHNQINGDTMMKKMILFAAMFGLAAAFTVKADGAKDNWDSICARCHGADGAGGTKMGAFLGVKDFTDAKVQAGFTDDAAFKALKEGLKSDDGKTLMKPFGDQLSDDDIKALVAYVRTLKK